MSTVTADRIAAAVELIKTEIRDDVENGTIPRDVPDFSSLHSYVDANMYGGEHIDALYEGDGNTADLESIVEVQQRVEDWLKGGGLTAAPEASR